MIDWKIIDLYIIANYVHLIIYFWSMLPSKWGDNQNLKLNAYKRLGVYTRKNDWLMQCILFSVMD